MKQTRLINQIVGGSYVQDERIVGCAVSQNLYAEAVEEASNGFYYTSALRSVEGERMVLDVTEVSDPNMQGCRGMFVASDDTIFAAFGMNVVRITKNPVTGAYSYERIYTQSAETIGPVRFCETGGINSHVVWIDGTEFVKAYPLDPEKATSQGISVPVKFRTPLRVYLTSDEIMNSVNEHVVPTSICSLAGCLAINDPLNDTWYYTDPYALGGTTYTRSVYDLDANGNIQYISGTYKVKTRSVSIMQEDPSSHTAYIWLDRYSKPKFQTAEYAADNVAGMVTIGDILVVMGSKSIQFYSQQTSTDAQGFSSIVFSSVNRNIRDLGLKAPDSMAVVDGKAVFLGSSSRGERSVWFTEGSAPVRISTNAIEREMEGRDITDAYGFGWMNNGHQFYCITIPSIRKTFCYDFATRQWHNRSSRLADGTDSNWWARFCVNAAGDILLSSGVTKKVAVMDKNKYDDYEERPIIKRRTCPILMSDFSPFIVNDLQLVWNTGTTRDVTNAQGARDPVVMLEVSTDGGNTYGEEIWGYGGETGQYSHRTIWYGIGMGTLFVFRFTISDRVNVVITGAKVSHTRLAHF